MKRSILVEKHSGEKEPFSSEKLRKSLARVGADDQLIDEVEELLSPHLREGIRTADIYHKAFRILRKLKRASAARYSLKNAIMELGPTGYPFEQFVGELLRHLGYQVQVGQVVRGHCVSHEVDVVASDDTRQFMVECKFYNNQGKYCNVQVPLYIDSRFRDIEKVWRKSQENQHKEFSGWVVTNTRFTSDAMDYGKCIGLKLVSWDYPYRESLKDMIEQTGLFPVTVLTSINRKQKQLLLENNIVLCRQLIKNSGILQTIGLSGNKADNVIREATDLVSGLA